MERTFTALAGGSAAFAGRPPAFTLALATIVLSAVTGPIFWFSEIWQLVINTPTTIVTFLMIFLVQNSQNRHAAAIQAKLVRYVAFAPQAGTIQERSRVGKLLGPLSSDGDTRGRCRASRGPLSRGT